MKSQVIGLRVGGTICGLVCCGHLVRLVAQFEVTVGGHPIPFWASVVACLITGGLSLWLWKLSTLHPDKKEQ